MYIVTIACAPLAVPFIFKTEESAKNAYAAPADASGQVSIIDDFGQSGTFAQSAISCRLIEDCTLSKRGTIERSLHQQRTQVEFQRAAESDTVIRAGMRGPAGGLDWRCDFIRHGQGRKVA